MSLGPLLALAPLSIVQAVLSGGLVFLAVLAERLFDFQLGRWQWFGVTGLSGPVAECGLERLLDGCHLRGPNRTGRKGSPRRWPER